MATINDIKLGDRVKSTVWTFSQKYMLKQGYEEYNMTKEGIVIELGKTFFDTYIETDNGDKVLLAVDPGTSGVVNVEIINIDASEEDKADSVS